MLAINLSTDRPVGRRGLYYKTSCNLLTKKLRQFGELCIIKVLKIRINSSFINVLKRNS